jgi:hypothetical protein
MAVALGSWNFNLDLYGDLYPAKSRLMQFCPDSNFRVLSYDKISWRADEPRTSTHKARCQVSGVAPMPITDRDLYREAIRRTLRQRAGDSPDAPAIAKATAETWLLMSAQLTPVIGGNGVDAILKRSVHLTSVVFPWLSVPDAQLDVDSLPVRISVLLAGREPVAAAQASSSLLITFTELLATLIGNSLTRRLLDPVWITSPGVVEQEKTS